MFRFKNKTEISEIKSFTRDLLRRTRAELSENVREIMATDLIERAGKAVAREPVPCSCKHKTQIHSPLRRHQSAPVRVKGGVDHKKKATNGVKPVQPKTPEEICREKRRTAYQKKFNLSPVPNHGILKKSCTQGSSSSSEIGPVTSTPKKSTKEVTFKIAGSILKKEEQELQEIIADVEKIEEETVAPKLQETLEDVKETESEETVVENVEAESDLDQTLIASDVSEKAKFNSLKDSILDIQMAFNRLKIYLRESRDLEQQRRRSYSNSFSC